MARVWKRLWFVGWMAWSVVSGAGAEEAPALLLWPGKPPVESGLTGPEEATPSGVKNVSMPTLTPFLVSGAPGPVPAVIVVPGGGYGSVCHLTEGTPIAEWLGKRGIAAFVLKYRLPNGHPEIPMLDARRAIRLVRARAQEWKVDPAKIGIWGFSAGGHLAATVATAGETEGDLDGAVMDPGSARPDFAILFYPVISMDEAIGHGGSRKNLFGEAPAEACARLSTDTRVTASTPPSFLLHAADDRAVNVDNSLRFVAALARCGVPAEAHVFEKGGHGPPAFQKNPSWESALEDWLRRREVLPAKSNPSP